MKRAFVVPAIALLVGLGIAYVDSRATWDDAGITAGAVFLTAAGLAALRPRLSWLTGLCVGLPVLGMNVALHSNYGSVLAVVIALVGAGVGFLVGQGFRMNKVA